MKTISDVRAMMNQRYGAGTAYQSSLPFDALRGNSIRSATLELAGMVNLTAPTNRVLDVGSGEGGICSFWPHPRCVTGVEISELAIEKARASYPGVKFHCGAIEEYELGAGEKPYDGVVAQESIEHWTDADRGMDAIRNALRPDGYLVITTPNRDSLHCRMRRKLEMGEAPYCSDDHIHEYGFDELIDFIQSKGFVHQRAMGVGLLPYWTLESMIGSNLRYLTDNDEEVCWWFERMGGGVPPEFAFIQCHLFERDPSWHAPAARG